jgi:hypothetical protein
MRSFMLVLLTKYYSDDHIKKTEIGGQVRERARVYRVLVEKPEGKRSLRKPRYRWEDNIKMDLQEMGWGAWTGLMWLRTGDRWWVLVNAVMTFLVLQNVGNFLTS